VIATALAEENRRLRNRVDELEAEIRDLRREHVREADGERELRLRRELGGVTRCEARLLLRLMAQPGRVLSRLVLLEAVNVDRVDDLDWKIIDVYVCRLRPILAARGLPGAIETVWGQGYRLREEAAARIELGAPWDRSDAPAETSLQPASPGLRRRQVLEALADGPKLAREVAALIGTREASSYLTTCRDAGLVKVVGHGLPYSWAITDAGRAWLAERSPQGIAA
jgi:DNA-binding winged helix-turn-helix (wHTH) protein